MPNTLTILRSTTPLAGGSAIVSASVRVLPGPEDIDALAGVSPVHGEGRAVVFRQAVGGDQAGTLQVVQAADISALNALVAPPLVVVPDDMFVTTTVYAGGLAVAPAEVNIVLPFIRAFYTNGGVAQTRFSVDVTVHFG